MGTPAKPLISTYADEPEMRELARMFVDELPARLEQITRALDAHQISDLTRLAHQLKGAAGGYGFMPITEKAREVETLARSEQDKDGLIAQVDQLVELCQRATV